MLIAKSNIGKMKDSPCQTCIVKILCNKWCLEFSNFLTKFNFLSRKNITIFKLVKIPRRESWVKLKVRAKSVLSE